MCIYVCIMLCICYTYMNLEALKRCWVSTFHLIPSNQGLCLELGWWPASLSDTSVYWLPIPGIRISTRHHSQFFVQALRRQCFMLHQQGLSNWPLKNQMISKNRWLEFNYKEWSIKCKLKSNMWEISEKKKKIRSSLSQKILLLPKTNNTLLKWPLSQVQTKYEGTKRIWT